MPVFFSLSPFYSSLELAIPDFSLPLWLELTVRSISLFVIVKRPSNFSIPSFTHTNFEKLNFGLFSGPRGYFGCWSCAGCLS